MPTEPRQVEVVCPYCRVVDGDEGPIFRRGFCNFCLNVRKQRHPAAPDSLTARMLDLAEAVDRMIYAGGNNDAVAGREAYTAYVAALRAVRSHPDYVRPQ